MRSFFGRDVLSLGCLLILSRPADAAASPSRWSTRGGAAFAPAAAAGAGRRPKTTTTAASHRSSGACCRRSTRLQANPILEMVADAVSGKRRRNDDIGSVRDFDAELAGEIRDALSSAGVDCGDAVMSDDERPPAANEKGSVRTKIVRPPVENKAPKYVAPPEPELPPHTALAQVVANQYGIDLRSVAPPPSGGKIAAEDVEYHAWRVAQPPCTPEALERAYSLGLDLNDLYDDEDRKYVMDLGDVQLYEENLRSLNISSQTSKKMAYDSDVNARKRTKKMSALDERMERNMEKLSEKARRLAGTVTGGIVQRVQEAVGLDVEALRGNIPLVDMNGRVSGDIETVGDFDADLASQIADALSSVNIDDNKTDDVPVEVEEIESSPSSCFTREELQTMTCVELKERLRERGMKVSGKKADLIARLLDGSSDGVLAARGNDRGKGSKDRDPLFFAS